VQVDKAPLAFRMDGCVKFAYPHGHDHVLLIVLENRTAPGVTRGDEAFLSFLPHQINHSTQGFVVNTDGAYEMVDLRKISPCGCDQ
jgi:hypothetical protein